MTRSDAHILVVEDEDDQRLVVESIISKAGYQVTSVDSAEKAIEVLANHTINLIYADWQLGAMDGMELLERVRQDWPEIAFILVTGHGSIEQAVSAMRAGADDYLSKPFSKETLIFTVQKVIASQQLYNENKQLKQALGYQHRLVDMIGASPSMQRVFKRLEKIAATKATVMISGESGTGKELAARALHKLSPRVDRPFIAINCAAIPDNLAESEFFGAMKGAYTGIDRNKKGKFEAAQGGTIFLDEVGELDLSIQAKLLRLLQEGVVTPLGSHEEIPIDIRLITATNRNLEAEVEAGQFREDLYFRLNVVPLVMPPLRERLEDITSLAKHFLETSSQRHGLPEPRLNKPIIRALQAYGWPGNVRELSNLMERMVLLSEDENLNVEDLDLSPNPSNRNAASASGFRLSPEGISWQQLERDVLKQALELADNNRAEAARLLDLPYKAFLYRLEKYDL